MNRFRIATLAALLALLPFGSANAQAVLDQSDTLGMAGGTAGGLSAQTFTVGITGKLSSVEILVYDNGQPVTVDIASTLSGVPTYNTLAQDTVTPLPPAPFTGTWVTLDFPSAISVVAGEVLAMEVDNGSFEWGEDPTGSYTRGGPFWNPFNVWRSTGSFSYQFQTFVIPAPEPSSFVLAAFGAAGLLLWARRWRLRLGT